MAATASQYSERSSQFRRTTGRRDRKILEDIWPQKANRIFRQS